MGRTYTFSILLHNYSTSYGVLEFFPRQGEHRKVWGNFTKSRRHFNRLFESSAISL